MTSIVYAASFFGKGFTGFLMEVIGRRWTIAYALTGSLPGLALMLLSHRAGNYAGVMMVAGGLIIDFAVLSAFTATRVYLSEQFPTALRGRGHIFGESFGRLFAGGFAPFLMEPHTGWRRSSSTRYLWSWRSAPSFRYSLAARPLASSKP